MNSRYEILAKEKGYFVDKQGNAYSPQGNKVGTRGKGPYLYFGIRVSKTKVIKVYIHRLQAYQKFGDLIFNDNIEVRHLMVILLTIHSKTLQLVHRQKMLWINQSQKEKRFLWLHLIN